jgi:hypothetical protein
MSKAEIMNKVSRTVHRAGLKLKKHSPEILVVSGIIGFVGTAVMAYKAAPKVNEILEDAKENIEAIHKVVENPPEGKEYTEEDKKQALTVTYAKTGLELVKVCAPMVAVGTLSTVSILAGHNILRKRYVATAAAYTVLDRNFKDYRGRVIERFGEKLDKELRFNIKTKEIEEIVTNEDGSESVVKTTVEEIDPNTVGDYVRFFDEWCTGYEKNNPDYNLMFLKHTLNYANEKLQAQGHLFMNEVLDMLGMPRTPVGSVVGWIYNPEDPTIDSYVSFGDIFDTTNPNKREFVNGREPAIMLQFNCDGPIFEKI